MLLFWLLKNPPSLLLIPGPLGLEVPFKVQSTGKKEVFAHDFN